MMEKLISKSYEWLTMGRTTALYELVSFLVFTTFGSILLLNPDNFFGIEGISQADILKNIPEWVALLVVIASPQWMLVTKYANWVSDRADNAD